MKKLFAFIFSALLASAQPVPPITATLTVNTSTGAITAPVSASTFASANNLGRGSPANPTGTVSSTVGTFVNGSALTFMRSDAAPTLPATLTGLNAITSASSTNFVLTGNSGAVLTIGGAAAQLLTAQTAVGDTRIPWRVNLANQTNGSGGTGAARGPFNANISDTAFSGAGSTFYDAVMAIGYNADAGGGNIVDAEPKFSLTFEQDFWDGVRHNMEAYFEWRDGSAISPRKQQRPIFWQWNRATGAMLSMQINSSAISWIDWDTQATYLNWSNIGMQWNGMSGQASPTALTLVAQNSKQAGVTLTSTAGTFLTGGESNMTILAGTGTSRSLLLQVSGAGGTPATVLTLNPNTSATFAGALAITGALSGVTTLGMNGAFTGATTGTFSSTTDSTSTSTGAVVISGGLGLAKSLSLGGLVAGRDGLASAPTYALVSDTTTGIYLPVAHNLIGFSVGGTRTFQFDNTSLISGASGSGTVGLPSSGTVTLNAATGQSIVSQINAVNVSTQSATVLSVLPATASSSTSTGALVVGGGLGVAGQINAASIGSATTATTQTSNDSSTKIATTAYVKPAAASLSGTGSVNIDCSTTNAFYTTLTGNATYAFTNSYDNMNVTVVVTGDSSHTVTWTSVKWTAGTAPTQTLSQPDVYVFKRINSVTYGSVVQNMQ